MAVVTDDQVAVAQEVEVSVECNRLSSERGSARRTRSPRSCRSRSSSSAWRPIASFSPPPGRAAVLFLPGGGTPSARVHDRFAREPLDQPKRGGTARAGPRCRAGCRPTGASRARATVVRRQPRSRSDPFAARSCIRSGLVFRRIAPYFNKTGLYSYGWSAWLTPRVLGMGDVALRRHHSEGTILIGAECHQPNTCWRVARRRRWPPGYASISVS